MYSGAARPTYDDVNLLLKLYDLRREDRLHIGTEFPEGKTDAGSPRRSK